MMPRKDTRLEVKLMTKAFTLSSVAGSAYEIYPVRHGEF